ncbi:hypothetical protein D3C74_258340 [compost metagenome]
MLLHIEAQLMDKQHIAFVTVVGLLIGTGFDMIFPVQLRAMGDHITDNLFGTIANSRQECGIILHIKLNPLIDQ